MSEILLSFAANPKAGKSTLAQEIAGKYDLPLVAGSMFLHEWAQERGITLNTRPDYTAFYTTIRQELGPTVITDAALKHKNENGLLIDGLRTLPDLAQFRAVGGVTIACWCPQEIRFARSLNQASNKDAVTLVGFVAAEQPEYDDPSGLRTLQVMQQADFSIDTTRPVRQNLAIIDQYLASVFA